MYTYIYIYIYIFSRCGQTGRLATAHARVLAPSLSSKQRDLTRTKLITKKTMLQA